MTLTDRQQQVLDLIASFHASNGRPPSIRELQDLLGLSSPGTVHKVLRRLVELGAIRRSGDRALQITTRAPLPERPRVVHVAAYDRRPPRASIGEDGTLPLWDQEGVPAWA